MKEITAIIRMDMVNKTKEALLKLGFPAITARKVMGRGKKKIAYELFQDVFSNNEGLTPIISDNIVCVRSFSYIFSFKTSDKEGVLIG